MRDLQRIRYHLDLDILLATVPVSNPLDYCNSLLHAIANIDFIRLHKRVQNLLARVVTKSPPFSRSLPLLRSLHWLPVRFRILFKINLLTYKTLREQQLVYLRSMLAASLPSHSSSLCAICSQQVGCHGSPSFSILCHSDTVII